MSKVGKIVSASVLAVAAAALGLSLMAFIGPAEAETPGVAAAGRGGRGLCGEAGLEAAAEALGMTADELSTQLWGGESLTDLADEAGVDLADVQTAVSEACEQAMRDAIEQAVTHGTITREHADWLLEGLDKGFWGAGRGFGFGRRGGFGGHGFFGAPAESSNPSGTGFFGGYRGYGRSPYNTGVTITAGGDA